VAFLRFSTLISALNPSTDGATPGDVERYVLGFKVGRNYHCFPCLIAIVCIEGGKEKFHPIEID
jgi:hypothetical protein